MDESENHKIEEEPHKEDFRSDEEAILIESDNVESLENVKEETPHEGGEFSMDQRTINVVVDLEEFHDDDEKKVVLDSHIVESEPPVELVVVVDSLAEEEPVENLGTSGGVFEFKAKETDDDQEEKVMVVSDDKNVAEEIDESNEVVSSTAVMDLVSKEFDSSLSVENGFQTSVSKGIIETCLDEKNDASSLSKGIEETLLPASDETVFALDLPSVEASKGGENCSLTEFPESTENEPYIAVPMHPLRRTSWRDCCGLFQVLRRFN